ncbi:sigma factor-like helix-turn-helix DNA-binding protein [Vallitalea okinawensis]|uniref:sigma factor-like helix-turn-helix DNA-binding protein n=1 Tax=Vallitalea okinawensis TaxID=2078660 RepID=UPI000CFCB654|nr:sigma factor-like helix-turn-helix DNA-binding protein [Vallitalea okinawensis]
MVLYDDAPYLSKQVAQEILDVIAFEDKQEKNQQRRYYRHNVSLELMNEWYIHYTKSQVINDNRMIKELNKYLSFVETIEDLDLYDALHELTDFDIRIIKMRYEGQLTFKQIGECLKMKEDTVAKRHKRALRKLKIIIENKQK